jgi:hypothetical protein
MPCLAELRLVIADRSGKPITDKDLAAFYDDDLMDDEFKKKFPLLCEECREYAESRQWKRRDVQEKPLLWGKKSIANQVCEDCRGVWEDVQAKGIWEFGEGADGKIDFAFAGAGELTEKGLASMPDSITIDDVGDKTRT